MRKIREVLRLKFDVGLSAGKIAASLRNPSKNAVPGSAMVVYLGEMSKSKYFLAMRS